MATGLSATSHGSAKWEDWEDEENPSDRRCRYLTFEQAREYTQPLLSLGVAPHHRELHAIHYPNQHLTCFAPNRSGKGASLIVPSLMLWSSSCLVLDPKGENAWRTAEHRRRPKAEGGLGQDVFILDPFGGVERYSGGTPEAQHVLNPLAGLSLDAPEDALNLADALITVAPGQNAHFDTSARDLVEGLILFEVELAHRMERVPSMANVRGAIANPQRTAEIARLAQGNAELPEGHFLHKLFTAAGKLARFQGVEKDSEFVFSNEIASVFSTAITQTAFLDHPKIQASMEGNDFQLSQLAKGNTTVYVVLPAELLGIYGRWMRLILARAISDVVKLKPNPPVLFVLDEFGTVGRLDIVARALGLMSGLGILIWSFLQDINQLKFHYREWQTFIANSGVVQYFATNDFETARYVSQTLGRETLNYLNPDTRALDMTVGEALQLLTDAKMVTKEDEGIYLNAINYNRSFGYPGGTLFAPYTQAYDVHVHFASDSGAIMHHEGGNPVHLGITPGVLPFLATRIAHLTWRFLNRISWQRASGQKSSSDLEVAARVHDRLVALAGSLTRQLESPEMQASRVTTGRELMMPDEVMRAPAETMITFRRGRPVRLHQKRYWEMTALKGHWRRLAGEAE
jgi:type IV secretory pathway TraG/TraD family ATPase VirD4